MSRDEGNVASVIVEKIYIQSISLKMLYFTFYLFHKLFKVKTVKNKIVLLVCCLLQKKNKITKMVVVLVKIICFWFKNI